jgi:septal ring factor EnvC (AmiA/AmiB activator)
VEADEIDYLLPFLLAVKCVDPNAPTEKEARKADRDCRLAYKERLLERVAIIQKRLEAENDDLLRRQQAFSRNRDHAEDAEDEFNRYCAEATFRIGILEQRLERQEALVTKKFSELEQKLASDPRLAVIHNPSAIGSKLVRPTAKEGKESPTAKLRSVIKR